MFSSIGGSTYRARTICCGGLEVGSGGERRRRDVTGILARRRCFAAVTRAQFSRVWSVVAHEVTLRNHNKFNNNHSPRGPAPSMTSSVAMAGRRYIVHGWTLDRGTCLPPLLFEVEGTPCVLYTKFFEGLIH